MIERTTKRKAYETKLPVSVVARVNSECADWEMSNANEFTHATHDRNLNPATPAVMTVGAEVGMKTIAWQAVLGVYSYGLWCLAEIISQDARAILDFP